MTCSAAITRNRACGHLSCSKREVCPPTSALTRTNGACITTNITTCLPSSTPDDNTTVNVVTENGVFYLMSLVMQEATETIPHEAQGVSGVRPEVRLFERLQ